MVVARDLVERFHGMVREREPAGLPTWITDAADSVLASFGKGIVADHSAVTAAMTQPWSNGQTEGQITKLKLVKRQMYGRAKLDLLRARLLAQRNVSCIESESEPKIDPGSVVIARTAGNRQIALKKSDFGVIGESHSDGCDGVCEGSRLTPRGSLKARRQNPHRLVDSRRWRFVRSNLLLQQSRCREVNRHRAKASPRTLVRGPGRGGDRQVLNCAAGTTRGYALPRLRQSVKSPCPITLEECTRPRNGANVRLSNHLGVTAVSESTHEAACNATIL